MYTYRFKKQITDQSSHANKFVHTDNFLIPLAYMYMHLNLKPQEKKDQESEEIEKCVCSKPEY